MRTRLSLLFAAAIAACNPPAEPDGPPMISGVITARDAAISVRDAFTIHVEEAPNSGCGVIFLVAQSTPIRRRTLDGTIAPASLSDLTIGRHVAVWAEAVTASCPGRSSAVHVEIVASSQ